MAASSNGPIQFSMTLSHRPRSAQTKGRGGKYRDAIRLSAIKKMNGPAIQVSPLYARIVWLHRSPVTGDIDNIIKPILDSMTGIVFRDDFLISQCMATRIDMRRGYTIADAGAPEESYQELIDLIAAKVDDIIYVEVGVIDQHRVVFGLIDGGSQ